MAIKENNHPVKGYKYVVTQLIQNEEWEYLFSSVIGVFNTPKEAYEYLVKEFKGKSGEIQELSEKEQAFLPSVSYKDNYHWFMIDPIHQECIK